MYSLNSEFAKDRQGKRFSPGFSRGRTRTKTFTRNGADGQSCAALAI